MPRDPSKLADTELGEWTVEQLLGKGAMGAVYKAHKTQDPEAVAALKVLNPGRAEDASGRARFVREAKVLARLDHPNCCRSYGYGEVEGLQWLALEFIDGRTLQQVIKLRGTLTVEEVVDMTRQILLGLAAAHAAGVIHRDVKPANMILDAKGRVRVVDFGLARRDEESMLLTAEGQIMGTPYYMSPEQCDGATVDGRADLYAVGAMMFHMLTGRPPFMGRKTLEILKQHITARVPKLKSLRPDAPAALDRFIGRLMRKDPADRYASCQKALEALLQLEERRTRKERAPAPQPSAPAPISVSAPTVQLSAPVVRASKRTGLPFVLRVVLGIGVGAAAFGVAASLTLPEWSPPVAALVVGFAAFKLLAGARRSAQPPVAHQRVRSEMASGRQAMAQGNPTAAAAAFLQAGHKLDAARAFETARDYRRAAELYRELERWEKAAELFVRCKDAPAAVEIFLKLGESEEAATQLERAGRPEEAARILSEKAAELESRRQSTQKPSRLARIDAQLARIVERASQLFVSTGAPLEGARLLARVGRHRDAAELYIDSGDRDSAAKEYLLAGDRKRASEIHERAGDVVAAARIRAEQLLKSGDRRAAALELERAGDYVSAAQHFEELGELEDAAKLLERGGVKLRAADLFTRAGKHRRAGELFQRLERYEDAARAFRQAGDPRREAQALARGGAPRRKRRPTTRKPAAKKARPRQRPPQDEDPRRWIGRQVDRYSIKDHLGSGAFAHVFLAEHVHLERPAALKVLRRAYASQPQVTERFLSEAKVVSRVRHPGIVEVYDFGSTDGLHYMALEYVEGRTLREVITTRGPLPIDDVAEIGSAILAAIGAAHKKGVIHRDLKPENVILDREGEVHVLDFGMAKVFWNVGQGEDDSESGFVGTPRYASPEAAGEANVDATSDQYSVGLILYELATGELPFSSSSPMGWLQHHAHTAPAPPSTRQADLPPEFDPIVLRALSKKPAARFPDTKAFAKELGRL